MSFHRQYVQYLSGRTGQLGGVFIILTCRTGWRGRPKWDANATVLCFA